MPYIICINRPGCLPEQDPRAIATLEEVRDSLQPIVREPADPRVRSKLVSQLRRLTESGGVIGPLPGGYVIDVQHVTWPELGILAGNPAPTGGFDPSQPTSKQSVIDAYNAA